ncbi:hypothetical protein [Burkholderia glumae]|uniref:Uncharacterized protein n=1 Tax=Burkholderia glumae TaxID=337 RepID=A0AAP9XYM1_BURGL|nr:hypothetical protein [Burkholderia glumae]AJY63748.1 hypothetical protein KS03_3741 [Burkholderia glumae LMG 2196 = ATCC 33617]MCM2484315.1 hypothetical protein [Burkholderia glumae]MCM2510006.1 hypothetical protein [Burkholderia glumae]MCM2539769.1 hypothetical protein [Burkholderia glumae]MCR1770991.1 hypothetical protein [Burkholderia glumae]
MTNQTDPLRCKALAMHLLNFQLQFEQERSVALTEGQRAAAECALGMCAAHGAGEQHASALESFLSGSWEAR